MLEGEHRRRRQKKLIIVIVETGAQRSIVRSEENKDQNQQGAATGSR